MNLSLIDLWGSMGGFVKGIVVVLFLMSIYSLGIAAAKWWRLRSSMRQTAKFAPEFARFLQEGQLDQAIALAEKQKVSHVARVLGEALVEVKPLLRDRATVSAGDINSAERAVERQMLILLSELKRGLGVLATVGATAPFVGLLGTVMGIVNAFTGMAASSSASGFGNFSLSSGAAQPITSVTITTPNATANGWDFLVDTITVTPAAVTPAPEPSTALILLSGAVGLWMVRRRR